MWECGSWKKRYEKPMKSKLAKPYIFEAVNGGVLVFWLKNV